MSQRAAGRWRIYDRVVITTGRSEAGVRERREASGVDGQAEGRGLDGGGARRDGAEPGRGGAGLAWERIDRLRGGARGKDRPNGRGLARRGGARAEEAGAGVTPAEGAPGFRAWREEGKRVKGSARAWGRVLGTPSSSGGHTGEGSWAVPCFLAGGSIHRSSPSAPLGALTEPRWLPNVLSSISPLAAVPGLRGRLPLGSCSRSTHGRVTQASFPPTSAAPNSVPGPYLSR